MEIEGFIVPRRAFGRRGPAGVLIGLLVVATGLASAPPKPAPAAAPPPAPPQSLYLRLGGQPAVEQAVDDFLGAVAADERINAPFAMSDVPRLRKRLVELFCAVTGGPCTYTGRDMKTAHQGMGITSAQFDALAQDLAAALDVVEPRPREPQGESSSRSSGR